MRLILHIILSYIQLIHTNFVLQVVREVDDHADIIGIVIPTDCTLYGGSCKNLVRTICMSRFWQLDDDGVYLITLNSIEDEDFPATLNVRLLYIL